jgi:hypothetical protein
MTDEATLERFLAWAGVDDSVFESRPDYRALLIAVDGLVPAPSDQTQLREDTTTALFILDALEPMTDEALDAAADELVRHLRRLGPDLRIARRLISTDSDQGG